VPYVSNHVQNDQNSKYHALYDDELPASNDMGKSVRDAVTPRSLALRKRSVVAMVSTFLRAIDSTVFSIRKAESPLRNFEVALT
jgi:hypothetical protein